MPQVTNLGERWVNPATGGSLFEIYDGGGVGINNVKLFDGSGNPQFQTNFTADWKQLTGKPCLTINPVAGQGSDYDGNTPGTQTGGLQEFINAVANSTVYSTNMYNGHILPGAVVCSQQVNVTAEYLVLTGCGSEASSIKANWSPLATDSLISWGSTPPKTTNFSTGTYVGFIGFDANSKAWTAPVVCPGYPGGYEPDIAAAAGLWEKCRVGGTTGVTTGFCLSSIEDSLVLHCDFSGAKSSGTGTPQGSPSGIYGFEQLVYNGTFKVMGGGFGTMNIAGSHGELVDCVWDQLTIGNNTATAHSVIGVKGVGGNGYPTSSASSPNYVTPVIYVIGTSKEVVLSTEDIDYSSTSAYAVAGSGIIGGPGASNCMVTDKGSRFDNNGQPLFGLLSYGGSNASGYAVLAGSVLTGAATTFFGTGSFINGWLMDESFDTYDITNSFIRPVGVLSAPFGGAVPSWHGSSIPYSVGPSVASGSASPTASETYTVVGTPIQVWASGGTGLSITVKDASGNTIVSTASSLSGMYIPTRFTINFGGFSGSPTFGVVGV